MQPGMQPVAAVASDGSNKNCERFVRNSGGWRLILRDFWYEFNSFERFLVVERKFPNRHFSKPDFKCVCGLYSERYFQILKHELVSEC